MPKQVLYSLQPFTCLNNTRRSLPQNVADVPGSGFRIARNVWIERRVVEFCINNVPIRLEQVGLRRFERRRRADGR
jgi:hypothetical protein